MGRLADSSGGPPRGGVQCKQQSAPSIKAFQQAGKGSCFPVSNFRIFTSLGVVAAAIAAAALWFRSSQAEDMGSVSHTWVAELRAGEPYDSSR